MLVFALTACSSGSKTAVSSPGSSTGVEEQVDNVTMANLVNGKVIAYITTEVPADVLESQMDNGFRKYVPDVDIKDVIYMDSLTDGLLMLRSGKVDILNLPDFSSRYLAQRNQDLYIYTGNVWNGSTCILVRPELTSQFEKVNAAIQAMNQDGTMQNLTDRWIINLPVGEEPAGGALPVIAGAETLKVGITGDEPPLDYVAADGKPGGFSIAMLSELAQRTQINIELVNVASSARFAALESGKIDAFLWSHAETYNHGKVSTVPDTLKIGDYTALMTDGYLKINDSKLTLRK